MIKPIAIFGLLLSSLLAFGQESGDEILGRWISDSQKSIIEFFKEGDKYSAKTVWLKNPTHENGEPKRDIKNPDESLQGRLLVGLVCIRDFMFTGENKYEGGTGYAPKYGKTLNGEIALADENTLELSIKVAFFSKTLIWTRLD